MAECEKIMQLCEESLDRTLTVEEQQQLDRHLDGCPACAAYLADLRFVAGLLGETPALPDGLHEQIMSGIQKETRSTVIQTHRPSRHMPVAAMLAAAAACVALVLSGALGDLMNTFSFGLTSGGSLDAGGASNVTASDMAAPAAIPPSAGETGAEMPSAAAGNETAMAKSAAPQGHSIEAPPAVAGRALTEEAGMNEGSPRTIESILDYGEESADAGGEQPQIGAFISEVMEGESFAGCYLVEGGSELPEIGQEQQRDASFAYYVVENNLAQLETLLDTLEKAGCTVSRYEESGVLFNETAKRVIFVVRLWQ